MFHAGLKLYRATQGATAIEYALIAALVSVAAIAAFQLIGTNLSAEFANVGAAL